MWMFNMLLVPLKQDFFYNFEQMFFCTNRGVRKVVYFKIREMQSRSSKMKKKIMKT